MQPRLGAHYTRGISLRFIIAIALFIGLSGCAVVGVTSAVVATTASVATLPVKAVGAAVKAVTPDGESEDDDEELLCLTGEFGGTSGPSIRPATSDFKAR